MSNEEYTEIPPDQLNPEILQAIIEEFINREGTDYGAEELSLEQKVEQVKARLQAGTAVIAFDPVSESCTLLSKE